MTVTAHPLHERTLGVAAAAMERGFEGYVIPMRCTAEMLARRMRSEHIDPTESLIYELDGSPAGILLIARRGRTTRVAALGLAPELRRQGLGRRAINAAVDLARGRGDERILLEVIASNHPAVELYKEVGFAVVRRLVGYQHAPMALEGEAELSEVDPASAAAMISMFAERDLSWQLAPASFAGAVAPLRGFAIADRVAALVDDSAQDVRLVGIAVHPALRRRTVGTSFLATLCSLFPGRSWSIPAIVPEGLAAGFLMHTGWELSPLSQFEMCLELNNNHGRV